MDAQELVRKLAVLIPELDAVSKAIEDAQIAFKVELAQPLTREKALKAEVDDLKRQLREVVAESGEKIPGVVLAQVNTVIWDEAAVIPFCCQYAPELLKLKGVNEIRQWFFRAPIQNVNLNGKPASVYFVETVDDAGVSHTHAVPCPFRLEYETQVRISESGLITGEDQRRYEEGKTDAT